MRYNCMAHEDVNLADIKNSSHMHLNTRVLRTSQKCAVLYYVVQMRKQQLKPTTIENKFVSLVISLLMRCSQAI